MTLSRVNYFDRQFLRPQDFTDEQAYQLALHRLHNIGAHIWGIVYGLEIVKDPAGNLAIQPGLAVDGYGRDLVLPYPQTIDPKTFDQKGSERLEVWLKYARLDSDFATGGNAGCGVQQGASTRSQELAEVLLQPPDPNLFVEDSLDLPERRQPPGVPANDLRFNPTRVPPDDPVRSWPVFLGMLRRMPGTPPTITIDLSGRPYAGLVGEMVHAPSGRAWMQVGSELKDDPYRYAVYLPEVETNAAGAHLQASPSDLKPRLGVTAEGEIHLRGDTTVEGDLTVDGGSVEFSVGPALASARPWRIYHVEEHEDPNNAASSNVHQLRIEMGAPPATRPAAGNNQVSIGVWSAKESRFMPCLTVDDRCFVTVHGNLHIEGLLQATNMPGQSAVSKEARANRTGIMMMTLAQRLNNLTSQRLDLEREIRSASPAAELKLAEAGAVTVATELQPKLDHAMQDVIDVLRENALLPRFMDLLGQEADVSELVRASAAPGSVEAETETEPEPPAEPEPAKPKRRPRKKKSE